jgi:hypothetical protein
LGDEHFLEGVVFNAGSAIEIPLTPSSMERERLSRNGQGRQG